MYSELFAKFPNTFSHKEIDIAFEGSRIRRTKSKIRNPKAHFPNRFNRHIHTVEVPMEKRCVSTQMPIIGNCHFHTKMHTLSALFIGKCTISSRLRKTIYFGDNFAAQNKKKSRKIIIKKPSFRLVIFARRQRPSDSQTRPCNKARDFSN